MNSFCHRFRKWEKCQEIIKKLIATSVETNKYEKLDIASDILKGFSIIKNILINRS